MKFNEIQEDCWTGYRQAGTKKKGDRRVPNCVPVEEETRPTPERNTALSLARDLKALVDDWNEIQSAGLDSSNINYVRKLKRAMQIAHEQIRNLGYRYDENRPELLRPIGRPLGEVKTGPEMTLNDLLYTAAAKAMHDASLEGIPMDYEEAIRKAARIYHIPYTPSELPRLLAQRDEIDKKLAMLKQGKQIAKARRKEKLAPTPAGSEEWFKTHSPTVDRIKPPSRTLEEQELDEMGLHSLISDATYAWNLYKFIKEYGVPVALFASAVALYGLANSINLLTQDSDKFKQVAAQAKQKAEPGMIDKIVAKLNTAFSDAVIKMKPHDPVQTAGNLVKEDLRKWFKEKWVRFGPDGKIRGDCARGSESEGKPKCLPQAKAHALGKKGRASVAAKKRREDPNPERRGPAKNVATKVREQYTDDDDWYDDEDHRLRDGDYVRDSQDGEYGEVFRMSGDPTERRVRILDRDGKGWYISPDRLVPVERDDPAIQKYFGKKRHRDMDEKQDLDEDVSDIENAKQLIKNYVRTVKQSYFDAIKPNLLPAAKQNMFATLKKLEQTEMKIYKTLDDLVRTYRPQTVTSQLDEKQDACYRKVKSRYKVWPSAYASGALVQCRKKGAANWGTGGKKK